MTRVPSARVALIAGRGECYHGCTHIACDAARLAREVLERRLADPDDPIHTEERP